VISGIVAWGTVPQDGKSRVGFLLAFSEICKWSDCFVYMY
jgi:hypothetical protein